MKQYKVLQGRIYGIPMGEIVDLTDEQAKNYGSEYVQEIKDIKKMVIQDEKQVQAPTTKQVKYSPRKK